MNVARRTGRRPGVSGTRGAILEAARRRFIEHGYDRATIRAIAADADVDPALVYHYFGGKENLFAAVMDLPFEPAVAIPGLLAGDPDRLGERIVRMFLSVWDDAPDRNPMLGLIRSAVGNDRAAVMVREAVQSVLFNQLARRLDQPDAELRASLAMSHLFGLALGRYVLRIKPLATADAEEIVAAIGPTIQRYLTGPLTATDR